MAKNRNGELEEKEGAPFGVDSLAKSAVEFILVIFCAVQGVKVVVKACESDDVECNLSTCLSE